MRRRAQDGDIHAGLACTKTVFVIHQRAGGVVVAEVAAAFDK